MSLENDTQNSAPDINSEAVNEDALAGVLGAAFGDMEPDEGHTDQPKPAQQKAKAPQPDDEDAEDEGDEPEDEADTEAEESDDESEDDTEDGEKPTTIKFKDGTEVTLDEIEKSYFREKDYRQKTAETAETRKLFEAAGESIKKAEAEAKEATGLAIALLNALMPQAPDASEVQTDPIGYMQKKAAYDANVTLMNEIIQKQQAIGNGSKTVDTVAEAQRIKNEFEQFGQKVPELKTPDAYRKWITKASKETSRIYGADPAAVAAITDHVSLLVLRDALAYRSAQAKAAPAKQGHAANPGNPQRPVLIPGKPSQKSAQITFAKQKNTAVALARRGDESALAELIGAAFSK